MFKSIFSKYFVAISVIILCSALAMGGLQMLMTSRYWNTEKQQILEDSADDISNMAGQYAIEVPPGSRHFNLSPAMLEPLLNARAVASSSTVLIADANGAILLVANGQTTNGQTVAVDSTKTVPSSLLQNRGMYLRGDMVGGVFAVRQCVAVAPIRIQNETIGYILVTVSASGVNTALLDTVQAFLLSAIFALTLTFMVLYILTYRLVRPLRQMAKATQQFAAGDFSVRVKVDGQDEVAQLGHALNQMAATLSSSEEMRRSFIANVSHELKTPMTTIGGFVDGILDGTIPEDKTAHYLTIVSEEAKRLSRTVSSMLALSRIDNEGMKLTLIRFDLTDLVCQTLLSFEQRLSGKNVTVEGLADSPRCDVTADSDLIQQVVYNLMDNATKFVNQDGTLALWLQKQNGRVLFGISNTGAGIPPGELPFLFERFYKGDKSRSQDKSGVGLGLYIAKTVIGLHHGEIQVSSAEGVYTEFQFWIPEEYT